jgi:hypothetical protein
MQYTGVGGHTRSCALYTALLGRGVLGPRVCLVMRLVLVVFADGQSHTSCCLLSHPCWNSLRIPICGRERHGANPVRQGGWINETAGKETVRRAGRTRWPISLPNNLPNNDLLPSCDLALPRQGGWRARGCGWRGVVVGTSGTIVRDEGGHALGRSKRGECAQGQIAAADTTDSRHSFELEVTSWSWVGRASPSFGQ